MANLVLSFGELMVGAIVLDAAIKGDSIPNVVKGVATSSSTTTPTSTDAAGAVSTATGAGSTAATATTAPANAPAPVKVQAMQTLASTLAGKPYIFGGGHSGFVANEASVIGFDCSGFVSAVLHAGGYLTAPTDTVNLPNQPGIENGPGQFVTIYDRDLAGAAGHVIIDLDGQWWESGGGGTEGAPSTHQIAPPDQSYLSTFDRILHPSGL